MRVKSRFLRGVWGSQLEEGGNREEVPSLVGMNLMADGLHNRSTKGNGVMQIVVRSIHLDGSEALHEYATRKVKHAFRFIADPAARVLVLFSDVNGPRGGEDKLCRIRLTGHREGAFVEVAHTDSYAAFDLAVERLTQTVRRQVERRRTWKDTRSVRTLPVETSVSSNGLSAAEL